MGPASKSAKSPNPRSKLRWPANNRWIKALGRIQSKSEAIGLAKTSPPPPCAPPKRAQLAWLAKLQLTVSIQPRAARLRRPSRTRFWLGVKSGTRRPPRSGNLVVGRRSKPAMRAISSTRSALPTTSRRQDGTLISRVPGPVLFTPKPSWPKMVSISVSLKSMPVKRAASVVLKSTAAGAGGTWPTSRQSEASPPHKSKIICVASSSPVSTKPVSTPRSNRYFASD